MNAAPDIASEVPRRIFVRPPTVLWLVAVLAGLFHLWPYWRAASVAPAGWTFTNNLSVSPDAMQYRVWTRQSQQQGPIVDNRFTSEPNRQHLPVFVYYLIGGVAKSAGVAPEVVDQYLGALLAAALTMFVFLVAGYFMPDRHAQWWTFWALMLGGGLGAHLKILNEVSSLRASYLFQRLVSEPLAQWPVFEDYRSHYLLKTLPDTHFLVIWIVALAAVLAFQRAARRMTPMRVALAVGLYVALTVLHVYEGVTLCAVAVAVAACLWGDRARRRDVTVTSAAVIGAVLLTYAGLGLLYRRSGLPMPDWRAVNILFAVLLIAYPLAWVLIAMGWRQQWERADFDTRFLFGWLLGCLAVTLSGPFFPYPDRGTMTLQVPVIVLAMRVYFDRWSRVGWRAIALGIVFMGVTPVWLVARTWRATAFRAEDTFSFLNEGHRNVLRALKDRAGPDDVLLAGQRDELWLAPDYPGRHYVAHFFLTVNYAEKAAGLERFLTDTSTLTRSAFLERARPTLVYVDSSHGPELFAAVPGLTPVAREPVGWLFTYSPSAARER